MTVRPCQRSSEPALRLLPLRGVGLRVESQKRNGRRDEPTAAAVFTPRSEEWTLLERRPQRDEEPCHARFSCGC
uniref:Uncharacterized protein n=1 Tax=Knipowitschia caucasica TaxID=637954 RepID=A0AAV2M8N7_KNICA